MDNSKILAATDMKQEELCPLKEGIAKSIAGVPEGYKWPAYTLLADVDARMDSYSGGFFK